MVDPISAVATAAKFGGVIAHIHDYKHLKKHDKDLKKHNEDLEKYVKKHNEELSYHGNVAALQGIAMVKWLLLPQARILQNKHKENQAYNCLLDAKKLLISTVAGANEKEEKVSLHQLVDKRINELTDSFARRLTQEYRDSTSNGDTAPTVWLNKYRLIVMLGERERKKKLKAIAARPKVEYSDMCRICKNEKTNESTGWWTVKNGRADAPPKSYWQDYTCPSGRGANGSTPDRYNNKKCGYRRYRTSVASPCRNAMCSKICHNPVLPPTMALVHGASPSGQNTPALHGPHLGCIPQPGRLQIWRPPLPAWVGGQDAHVRVRCDGDRLPRRHPYDRFLHDGGQWAPRWLRTFDEPAHVARRIYGLGHGATGLLCAPCRDHSCDYEMHFAYHPHCSQDDRDILLHKANKTYDWPLQRRAEILAH